MEKHPPPWTLGQLAELLGGELAGPSEMTIRRLVAAGSDDPQGLTFAESPEYLELAARSAVGAALVGCGETGFSRPHIRSKNPRADFALLLSWSEPDVRLDEGAHPTAIVHPLARVDPTARIGAYCVVSEGCAIRQGASIHAFCHIGPRCSVGEGCVLHPRVTLVRDVALGARTVVHSGAVIGADGFGYAWDGTRHAKIPQIGGVKIGEDVEIGANTCIDCSTVGDTTIGDGTKIDNQVQIAHNVSVGRHCVIAGLTGIAGSVKIGDRVVMGGAVSVRDHVSIVDMVSLAGRSVVDADIVAPGEYFGVPARPLKEAIRSFLLLPRLPELFSRLRKVESEVLRKEKS
jgi:UDP-3-O-[3-hydroxymyristoyl] glucosamine N-acyltransferase